MGGWVGGGTYGPVLVAVLLDLLAEEGIFLVRPVPALEGLAATAKALWNGMGG